LALFSWLRNEGRILNARHVVLALPRAGLRLTTIFGTPDERLPGAVSPS
jgi:hypothetical protein